MQMNDPSARPATLTQVQRSVAAIVAATVLNLPFGTIYAFSVFLAPMEQMLDVGRTQTTFVFALATVALTVGMNAAPSLYRILSPVPLLMLAGVLGASGLALTASATSLYQLAVGYGVLFGLGGGIAFILVQQGVNQTLVAPSGLVNGYVVSLYPLGAMLGAPLFGYAIVAHGLRATLAALALTVLAAAVIAVILFRLADIRLHDRTAAVTDKPDRQWNVFLRLFAVFFLAAAAGLMVLSQAAAIVQAYGGQTMLALGATTAITGAIAGARIGGGWLVDRFPMPRVAAAAHLWSLAGALLLTTWPGPLMAVPALAMIGMGYGIISGATAGAIAHYWPRNAFGRIAGMMYIAWCVAAISLPVLAGWLFDRSGTYATAVMVAAGVNLLGVYLATGLPRQHASRKATSPG
jgi:MFS transporter, OFA family, oxalate/formate antiporter